MFTICFLISIAPIPFNGTQRRPVLACWRPYAKSNLAAPDHREPRSTPIVIMTRNGMCKVTLSVENDVRLSVCPSVRLLHASEADLCADHVRVGGGVL